MNWRDFMVLATRLAAGTTEADWRTTISRAYYAAFHVGRRLFADLRFSVPRAEKALSRCSTRLGKSRRERESRMA